MIENIKLRTRDTLRKIRQEKLQANPEKGLFSSEPGDFDNMPIGQVYDNMTTQHV